MQTHIKTNIDSNKVTSISPNRLLSDYKVYGHVFIASIFSIILIWLPWEALQGFPFVDRKEYYSYFVYEENVLDYRKFISIIDYLKNETLWHYMVPKLAQQFNVPIDYIFLTISFVCMSTFSLFLIKRKGCISLLLLLNPLFIALSLSQLRLALAFTLLLLAYMANNKLVMLTISVVSAFIHTATFIFIGIYSSIIIIKIIFIEKETNKHIIFLSLCLIGLIVSLALGVTMKDILTFISDRRADVYTGNAESGIKFTLFWSGLLLLFSLQDKAFYRDTTNAYAIIILSTVTFNLFTGGYSSRFIAVSLPMIFSSMLEIQPIMMRVIAIVLYLIYLMLQWIYWLHIKVL